MKQEPTFVTTVYVSGKLLDKLAMVAVIQQKERKRYGLPPAATQDEALEWALWSCLDDGIRAALKGGK